MDNSTGSPLTLAQDFQQFLSWEVATRDVLDVKRVYIDMAGDLAAGVMLSEIVYWHLPNAKGKPRMVVEHEGYLWIATRRYEWWERCRLSPDQADYALRKLIARGLVEKRLFKFNGQPTVHLRLRIDEFLAAFQNILQSPAANPFEPQPEPETEGVSEMEFGNLRNGNGKIPNLDSESGQIPLTETTDNFPPPPPANPPKKVSASETPPDYPSTPLEAASHPDLVLFQRLTDGLFPGKVDWRVIVDRMQFLRQRHSDLDDARLVQVGKPYWQAWVERGYSPTHPDFLEWWMTGRIPPKKTRRKGGKPPEKQESAEELEAARQRGREALLPLMQGLDQKVSQEV